MSDVKIIRGFRFNSCVNCGMYVVMQIVNEPTNQIIPDGTYLVTCVNRKACGAPVVADVSLFRVGRAWNRVN